MKNKEVSKFGKFKNEDALYIAYLNLEKEFTKKCQELSEYKDKNTIICCFCGKRINKGDSHDIRPLVSNHGDRCCFDCNQDIVNPNRQKFWFSTEIVYVNVITVGNKYLGKDGKLYDKASIQDVLFFSTECDATIYILQNKINNAKIERYMLREDK